MPNHVQNEIRFYNSDDMREVLALILKEEENEGRLVPAINFSALIQMPESNENFFNSGGLTQEKEKETGVWNWYKWSVACWGTKWGGYETEVLEEEQKLRFETAWAAPLPVLFALAARFPKIDWRWSYADEDYGSNLGVIDHVEGKTYVRDVGVLIAGEKLPVGSEPLRKFACELHGADWAEWKRAQEA